MTSPRTVIPIALALSLGACRDAPDPPAAPPSVSRPEARETACPTQPNIDGAADNLVLTARLAGRPIRILVDTGASGASVSPELAESMRPIPGRTARFAGAEGRFRESPVYAVSGLDIGGTELGPFDAYRFAIAKETGADLAIGLEQLAPYVVDMDFSQGVFCLRSEPVDLGRAGQPIARGRDGQGDVIVSARFGEFTADRMIFDTGAGVSAVNEDLLSRLESERLPDAVVSVDAAGFRKRQYFVRVPQMCVLGACKARQILMPGADLSELTGYRVHGYVGLPFMRGLRVVLDFPRGQMALMEPAT